DSTIRYRVDGTCNGDFDEVQLKEHWLRADSSQDGYSNSMVYDGVEKLAYFIDHRSHTFMQVEMDEDAVDLQKDVMTSLGKNMKKRAGFDPFQMAGTLCPGLANEVDSRDRQPGEAVDCGNGTAIGENGGAPNSEQMAAMMQKGQMPAMDSDTQQMMQKMMEQQMAQLSPEQQAQMKEMLGSRGGASGMPGGAKAPSSAPQRIDRDAGEIVIDGITCSRRQHLRGDTMLREDCYATVATLKLDDIETRRLTKFSKSLQEWSQSMTPPGMGAKRDKVDDRVLLRRTCFDAGHESGHATLTIERAPIAESRFAVPAGYKPMDLGSGMQDVEGGRQGSR
ncbi:MAG: hypothetical protein ACREPX_13490, partial [Rhodanobacteraceae bacterium]